MFKFLVAWALFVFSPTWLHAGWSKSASIRGMVSRTFNIFASKAPPTAARDALDVAARYFIYKLYDATRREPTQWASLKGIDESPATIARAVELGWVVFQPGRGGKSRTNEAALTDEGRRVARKGK
jgi:hypothetical protein